MKTVKLKLLIVIGLVFLISCNDDSELNPQEDDSELNSQEYIPGEVIVGIKSGTDINEIFNFINQFDHNVDNINSLHFTSDLSSDNLKYTLDFLNKKTYTNDGKNWFVTGYLHYQTNQITIFPRLFDIDNVEHQNDWLNAMKELELNEKHTTESSGVVLFNVPIGDELEWKNQFENNNIVDWVELNFITDIEPLHTK